MKPLRQLRIAIFSTTVLAAASCQTSVGGNDNGASDAASTSIDAPSQSSIDGRGKIDARVHHDDAASGGGGSTDASSFADIDATAASSTSFKFAVVGDTRPPNEDDTAHYPTAIITKIFADVAAISPMPDFVVGTGDSQYSNPTGTQASAQLDKYIAARGSFTNPAYETMGNHECTGYTDSNCGTGNSDGVTANYTAFMTKMVQPLGFSTPYYVINKSASDGSWTAKFVFIAANAWDSAQSAWLTTTLAQPTTYTFIMRHEAHDANTAPGVTPSEAIIANYPYTLKIVGHTHTYSHTASSHEVICGNGGAPLTSGVDYGYGIVERLSNGDVQFTEYQYETNAVLDQFTLKANGSAG